MIDRNELLLNDFSTRSFRDMADRDYIHARLAHRHRLIPQFQWSALHCLEKYVKAILLYNRIPSKELKHEVSEGLSRINNGAKFSIDLPTECLKFIDRLESGAEFRYFEVSYYSKQEDLILLDKTVSYLRRYCQVLDYKIKNGNEEVNILNAMINRINSSAADNVIDTCITSGWLEGIMKKKDHPARNALLWKNLYFGDRKRHSITMILYSESGNSPLYLHPEILDLVLQYVFLPKRIANAWREEMQRRKKKV
ncbi:HEPN domain-containing protein [Massilia sp. Root418]|uniref:HEPN domain-containing protein n=1 Tax=Massilia sp. Root418 TaxID=1736532 RepID=UPI000A54624E|nr:HEPN domain-containing protein [Massilia sp. Root418]